MKRALITGITGQDGSYLAELLLSKGIEVHGLIRRSSSINTARIDHLYEDPHEESPRLHLHYGDLCDRASLRRVVELARPDEVYHLGAQSHVRVSFDIPDYTKATIIDGTTSLFRVIHELRLSPRIYIASSSEMFGNAPASQNEETSFDPQSPYAFAKVYAHHLAKSYRRDGWWVARGILFNHESCRRGETFVTRKVTQAAARISLGLQKKLYLGNMDAKRDWGYAKEYVEAMWRMLEHSEPDDFVIATGEMHSVKELVDVAFEAVDLDWHDHVEIDSRYYRPTEVNALCGDASKAKRMLGWKPQVRFRELVEMMVKEDLRVARGGAWEPI